MKFEDKRILRKVLGLLDHAKVELAEFEFADARESVRGAEYLLTRLAANVRLNEVSEEESETPYVLRA